MGQLTITHSPAEGTRLSGTEKNDAASGILVNAGWRWSRSVGWYVPRSRDRTPMIPLITATADRLRAAGYTVTSVLDEASPVPADREARYQERAAARAQSHDAHAERLHSRSEQAEERADRLASGWPIGQPILVDHHGAARTERYVATLSASREESAELERQARSAEARADATRAHAAARTAPIVVIQRIERLQAKTRRLQRMLEAGERSSRTRTIPLSEVERARIAGELTELADETAYWQGVHRDQIAEGLVAGITQADITNGDEVLFRGDWLKVVLVNKKTVTVLSPSGRRGKLAYHQLEDRRSATSGDAGE